MTRMIAVLGVTVLCGSVWTEEALGPPVELLEGLQRGEIWAQFWGGGDTGVNGIIGRGEGGPSAVIISPGTQFWAQIGGRFGQSTGRQGQASLGSTTTSLSRSPYAQVWIPTACTNLGLPAPTERDAMVAAPPISPAIERISRSLVMAPQPQAVAQVAVWAVTDDPTPVRLRSYLVQQSRLSHGALTPERIMEAAARLLQTAGLDPVQFRLFR